ncbi:putative lipoprotein LppH [Mycolicibacterium phlei]|jgi:hypothetical protein|uniref:Uncharacterized protein n=1 Tax=Mycolicibacterium phlei DSM 43239 = CCUG 21000 TaxID=1226750 RepID=A0A5N5UPJ0_MYCPH|nr:hypothetical protein MPHLCCUG_01856 [Mycolicibacterium phlei]KAB7751512.1 hypothetical protein MPHL21000_24930 [Mycolicibacterium phlei DSM 43239 = CCUG 21000]KXW68328.1 hypothetical protein MPHL43070_04405 [Mycolicibacterium phlei DSM 43070]KXW71739.1 hypothetical protein MPHL43072_14735 [Mycolicibacterium phlei DSM 43072]VEG08794.1 putative lipoprotein LppH [Mycobacteroides chelonae]
MALDQSALFNTCSADPGDSAVRIAQQIGENVDAVW